MIGNNNSDNNEEFKTLVQLLFNRYGSLVIDIKTTLRYIKPTDDDVRASLIR